VRAAALVKFDLRCTAQHHTASRRITPMAMEMMNRVKRLGIGSHTHSVIGAEAKKDSLVY
jgi:hypothetical protein